MPQSSIEIQLGIAIGKLEAIEDRLDRADDSRAVIHTRLNELVVRTTHLESDAHGIKGQVKAIGERVDTVNKVTDDVIKLRTQAEGAGTAGRWALKVALAIVAFSGWLMALYTSTTGRPPP